MKLVNIFLLIIFGLAYFLRAKTFLDVDFGWGIRLGEIILKSGFPKTDPFSYTMSNYMYADHEWLTHVAMAKLYPLVGYTGLAIIFTLIAIGTILIMIWNSNARFIPVQILFVCAVLLSYFGIRSQVITWLFFAFLCKCTLNRGWWKKFRFFIPVLFLLWANLHGGFIVGLIVLLLTVLKSRKITDVLIVLVSILATLVTPYGLKLWQEIWLSIIDSHIRFFILEWRPIIFAITSITLLVLAYCWAFILHYRKKYAKHEILLFVLLFVAAFSSARNIPLFVIYALILTQKGIDNFISDVRINKIRLARFNLFYIVFFTLVSFLALIQLWGDYNATKAMSEDRYYPNLAIGYLTNHLPKGQIFSIYEWGGYLDWKLSQKKVFIDGRMASWRQKSSNLESGYILGEYTSLLLSQTSTSKVFEKYKVDTLLLPRSWFEEKSKNYTRNYTFKFIEEIKKNKFEKVYQDNVALIFTKKIHSSTAASLEKE